MSRASVVLGLLLATFVGGCSRESVARAPDDSFSFTLPFTASREDGGDSKARWRGRDVTVTAQWFAASDRLRRNRTESSVANAIVQRYALGEVDGSMREASCRVGGDDARCLEGRMTDSGQHRHGFVQRVGERIVVVEAIGVDERAVRDTAALARASFTRGVAQGGGAS